MSPHVARGREANNNCQLVARRSCWSLVAGRRWRR